MRAPRIPQTSDPPLASWTPPEATPAERDGGSLGEREEAGIIFRFGMRPLLLRPRPKRVSAESRGLPGA